MNKLIITSAILLISAASFAQTTQAKKITGSNATTGQIQHPTELQFNGNPGLSKIETVKTVTVALDLWFSVVPLATQSAIQQKDAVIYDNTLTPDKKIEKQRQINDFIQGLNGAIIDTGSVKVEALKK